MTKREPEPSELLAQLADGESIGREECRFLVERLRSAVRSEEVASWDFDEIYELTIVAGKIRAPETIPSLERLLDSQEPVTVCLVLDILCNDWGRADDYLERVMTFAVGSVWDDDQDVQEKAIEVLGAYVARRLKDEAGKATKTIGRVVELLWQQFASNDETTTVRRAAYRAIRTAYGRENECDKESLKALERLHAVTGAEELGPEFDREAIENILRLASAA